MNSRRNESPDGLKGSEDGKNQHVLGSKVRPRGYNKGKNRTGSWGTWQDLDQVGLLWPLEKWLEFI